MRVKVIQQGYYGRLREKGEILDVPEKAFSRVWMQRLDDPAPASPPPAPTVPVKPEPVASFVPPQVPEMTVPRQEEQTVVRRPPGRPKKA